MTSPVILASAPADRPIGEAETRGPSSAVRVLQLFVIFLAGLVLGVARWRTGSVYTPIFLHMVMNAVATVEIAMISAANPPVPVSHTHLTLPTSDLV